MATQDEEEIGSDDINSKPVPPSYKFKKIPDSFETLKEVSTAVKEAGLEECSLVFAIDYTLSNRTQGQKTFEGKSLHYISETTTNPYQRVICTLGETLEQFDDDGLIPTFGFGDKKTRDHSVFPLKADGDCMGFNEVLDVYNATMSKIQLGGPTNFAPIIKKTIEIIKKKKSYHILIIIADGQVTSEEDTEQAIVEASNYPLSIIVVGVGDGPWEGMIEMDDGLPERRFDNFQFVDFHKVIAGKKNPYAAFALMALMEIPEQYTAVKTLGLLNL